MSDLKTVTAEPVGVEWCRHERKKMISDKRARTAGEVIDQAISENKTGERLLYTFAIAFVSVGLSVLVWAVSIRADVFAIVGMLTSALFFPAMSSVRRTRKESIAIRLLEAPLSRADTAKEAAEMLQRLFHEIFRDRDKMEGNLLDSNLLSSPIPPSIR